MFLSKSVGAALIAALVLSLCACGTDSAPYSAAQTTAPPQTTAPAEITAPHLPFESQIAEIHSLATRAAAAKYPEWYELREQAVAQLIKLLGESGFSDGEVERLDGSEHFSIEISETYPCETGEMQRISFSFSALLEHPRTLFAFHGDGETVVSEAVAYLSEPVDTRIIAEGGDVYLCFLYKQEKDVNVFNYFVNLLALKAGDSVQFEFYGEIETPFNDVREYNSSSVAFSGDALTLEHDFNSYMAYPDGKPAATLDFSGGDPRYVFSRADFSGELPENWSSEYGLLLGLSGERGQLRTLFVRAEDGKIVCTQIDGQVVFPRGDELRAVCAYEKHDVTPSDDDGWQSTFSAHVFFEGAYGEDMSHLLDGDALFASDGRDTEISQRLYYAGEKFIGLTHEKLFYSGGTYHYTEKYAVFTDYQRLNSPTRGDGWDDLPDIENVGLGELILGKNRALFGGFGIEDYPPEGGSYLDFDRLMLRHALGGWRVQAPVVNTWYHPGNGSHSMWLGDFIDVGLTAPKHLTESGALPESMSFGDLTSLYEWNSLRDALAAPDGEWALLLLDGTLLLQSVGGLQPQFAGAHLMADEYVVSVNWACGEPLDRWRAALK